MDKLALKEYVSKVISSEGKDSEDRLFFFEKLFNNNLIDHNRLLKACINHFYDAQFKVNECNTRNTKLDTAIEFEVSTKTVHNTIYNFPSVTLDF